VDISIFTKIVNAWLLIQILGIMLNLPQSFARVVASLPSTQDECRCWIVRNVTLLSVEAEQMMPFMKILLGMNV